MRRLAGFTGADLGRFPSAKRLEHVWLAIHCATVETAGQPAVPATPFAVSLTLGYPRTKAVGADPELVKALIDGTVARSGPATTRRRSPRSPAGWLVSSGSRQA